MTLLFDLYKLESQTNNKDILFIEILKDHYNKTFLKKSSFKRFKSIKGSSYLLNPVPVLNQIAGIDIAYNVQYIKLAARRSFTDYRIYNQIKLDLSFFPDIDLNSIKTNPLLNITTNKIYFKFEEIYNGSQLHKN